MDENEECGLSWSGHNIKGDRGSIMVVKDAIHQAGIVPELKDMIKSLQAERDALRAAVKEARKAALEEALIACNGEALEDPTGSADDIAYDLAVEDCRNAIRAIAAKEPNRE